MGEPDRGGGVLWETEANEITMKNASRIKDNVSRSKGTFLVKGCLREKEQVQGHPRRIRDIN